jgi:hypothetical protein
MKAKSFFVIAAVAGMLAGCGNSPEKTCKKFLAVAEKAMKDKDGGKAKKSDDDMDKCVSEMKKMQDKDPETFKALNTCLDKSDSEDAMKCAIEKMMDYAMKDAKKGGDDDDKKSKKKSSDDDDDKGKKKKSDDDDSDKKKKKSDD